MGTAIPRGYQISWTVWKVGTCWPLESYSKALFVAGATIQIGGEIGELAGVWTAQEMRRQGLAFAVCHFLLREYFETGRSVCWLSAAEGALRLYEKLGFSRAGAQLNYGDRPALGS